MKWYIIDVEEMPEAIKARNLKEAITKARMYLGVREMQKDEFEIYGVVE